MKKAFKWTDFRAEAVLRIDECNGIIDRYLAEGLCLTLRQLGHGRPVPQVNPDEGGICIP